MIAPSLDQSGRGRAVTCFGSVEVEQLDRSPSSPIFACSGTPVDCVRIGLLSDLVGPIDVVAAGINHGVNLGDDSTISGTMGAALEGGLLGIPSIALSQQDDAGDFSLVSQGRHFFRWVPFAAEMVQLRARARIPPNVVINLNIPDTVVSGKVRVTRLGHFDYPPRWITTERTGDRKWTIWPYAHPDRSDPKMEHGPSTDIASIAAGAVSLTPIWADWTAGPSFSDSVALSRLAEDASKVLQEIRRDQTKGPPQCRST